MLTPKGQAPAGGVNEAAASAGPDLGGMLGGLLGGAGGAGGAGGMPDLGGLLGGPARRPASRARLTRPASYGPPPLRVGEDLARGVLAGLAR